MNFNFKDEILNHYLGSWGEVTVDRDPTPNSTQNAHLHNGIFNTLLVQRGDARAEDLIRFERFTRACVVEKNNKTYEGLFHRLPNCFDLNAHDDLIGIAASSYFMQPGKDFARQIVLRGTSFGWSFNNEDPERWTFRSWLGRHPGLKAYFKFCAGLTPYPWEVSALAATIYANSFSNKDSSDGRMMTFLKVLVSRERSRLCELAALAWEDKLNRTYKNAMSDVFAMYFRPTHPLALVKANTRM